MIPYVSECANFGYVTTKILTSTESELIIILIITEKNNSVLFLKAKLVPDDKMFGKVTAFAKTH